MINFISPLLVFHNQNFNFKFGEVLKKARRCAWSTCKLVKCCKIFRLVRYLNQLNFFDCVNGTDSRYYSYSVNIFKPNNICICIWLIFSNRIIFVFVFGHQNTIRSPLWHIPKCPHVWKWPHSFIHGWTMNNSENAINDTGVFIISEKKTVLFSFLMYILIFFLCRARL